MCDIKNQREEGREDCGKIEMRRKIAIGRKEDHDNLERRKGRDKRFACVISKIKEKKGEKIAVK